jgi:hypothetical protein
MVKTGQHRPGWCWPLSCGTDAEIEIKKKETATEVVLHFNVRSVRAPIRGAINLGFEIGRFLD